jgi:hypothetical protein
MDEAWIQQSLARLEVLEAYKAQVEASGQRVDLTEVDAEIAALYEVLESAAGEAEEPPAAQPQTAYFGPQTQVPPQPQVFAPAAAVSAAGYAPPLSPAMQSPQAPVGAPSFDAGMSYADVDIDPPRSKAPFIAMAALVVAGLGAGGWYVAGAQQTDDPVAAQPAGDPQVISASAVPEDTQEPEVAKGGDADRTRGTIYKKSNRPSAPAVTRRSGGGGGAANRTAPSDKKVKKDTGHKVNTIDGSRDPLAGVN